jgi:serine/threonine-protein kinase
MIRRVTSDGAAGRVGPGGFALIAIGSTLNQRFTLDKELGRGGMGAVYRATDQVLGRSVAIKVLKELGGEEVGKRIRLEAQILARLAHEHVVRLYDFGESEGMYYLVMEEVDGTSYSKRWRHMPLAERLRVAAEVAEALDYAHHQGVIHRDVKPANVLLTARGGAKLSDFGLSMTADAGDESGMIRGTPQYMSPEQAKGKRLDHRTDLYSLGVLLYECATGSVPFTGQSMSVISQHIGAEPTPPRFRNPEVSPELEGVILGLLAKEPSGRPSSGHAVARELREELARELARHPAGDPGVTAPTIRLPSAAEPAAEATLTRGLNDTPSAPFPAPAPEPPAGEPAAAPPTLFPSPAPPPFAAKVASPLARAMLEDVLAEPLVLSPDERYLCGHYLAYLLGGSRRRGLLLRRPLDPRNADRARLVLAMAWLSTVGPTEENVGRAAELLEARPEVRPALNPLVVVKYLAGRDSPAKRKKFRAARKQLLEASPYAQAHMTDPNGVLNPGLMPQALDDLRRIAPERSEVDDQLVERWNRVSEVWRDQPDFRQAVLRYATSAAHRDPASAELWPEVVYPLIERARWQRQFRPRHEAVWDYLSARVLRLPDAGVRLDRLIVRAVPERVAEELDAALAAFVDDPRLADDEPGVAVTPTGDDRLASGIGGGVSLHDLAAEDGPRDKGLVRLSPPDPYRFTQGEIRELWREATAALGKPAAPGGAKAGHRAVPVGPYRLAVIPSIRGRSAGQVVLQGMRNKQIEMLTPSLRTGGSAGRPVVAVWVYQDASAAIVYLDFKGVEKYILWHAPNAQQFNFDDTGDLNHMLYTLGLEVPDQLDRVLSKWFRPKNPV